MDNTGVRVKLELDIKTLETTVVCLAADKE